MAFPQKVSEWVGCCIIVVRGGGARSLAITYTDDSDLARETEVLQTNIEPVDSIGDIIVNYLYFASLYEDILPSHRKHSSHRVNFHSPRRAFGQK